MNTIPKTFLAIVMMILTITSVIGATSVYTTRSSAKEFANFAAGELENSNFNPSVVASCISEGKDNNYEVGITLYDRDGNVTDGASATDTKNVYMATVSCKYKIQIPFLSQEVEKETHAIAR